MAGCCTEDYCATDKYQWSDLKENTPVFASLSEGKRRFFRKFIHRAALGDYSQYRFFLEDVCDKEILIQVTVLYGTAWVTTSNTQPVSASQIGRGTYQSPFFSRICPQGTTPETSPILTPLDTKSTPGTFFVSVQGTSSTSFYVTLTVTDIPTTETFLPAGPCNSDFSSTHTCIDNNEIVSGVCPPDETLYFYTYTFSGCQQVTALLSVYGFGTDADLFGSNDITNPEPYFGSADFSSYLVRKMRDLF
jgi:hypothetical protein